MAKSLELHFHNSVKVEKIEEEINQLKTHLAFLEKHLKDYEGVVRYILNKYLGYFK